MERKTSNRLEEKTHLRKPEKPMNKKIIHNKGEKT
jgi:hypothetical protein